MYNDIFNDEIMLFEAANLSQSTEPVYVMLTHTGTVLSNLIKKVTGVPYSHASVSFDTSMHEMYSMGRKTPSNPFAGAFVKEDITKGLYKNVEASATYSLYVTFVTPEEKQAMISKLQELSDRNTKKELKYSFIGLLYNKFNIAKDRGDKFFCSEFVAVILESGKKYFNKHTSLIRPYDYAKHKEMKFVKKGSLRNYNQKEIDDKIKMIKEVNAV